MLKAFKKLWNNERGNVLVIAGAALPMVVGAAGLATDTIQWTLSKRQLQRAADSAAIAGVYDREKADGATTNTSSAVSHDLTLNLHTTMAPMTGYPQVTFPADSGVMTNQVNVTLAIQQKLPFSSLFLASGPTIVANAVAASVPAGGDACVQALEPTGVTGIDITGNAGIYMPDCVLYSNSPASNSAAAGGSSAVEAESVAAVGGIQESNNWDVDSYRPYSPALDDPFASVNPDPAQMKCAGHLQTKGKKTEWVYDVLDENTNMATATAQDGSAANCWTSMSVGSGNTLTVPNNFGPIYINGGDADLQGHFSCAGCAIVLTNKDSSSPIGQMKVNAGSNVNITAQTTGTFKGIAIYQDRRATDASPGNKINGHSGSVIQGALYFPEQELDYNGSGNTTAVCTMFVSRRIKFSGNSATTNKFKKLSDCSAYGLPSGGATRMVRLVG